MCRAEGVIQKCKFPVLENSTSGLSLPPPVAYRTKLEMSRTEVLCCRCTRRAADSPLDQVESIELTGIDLRGGRCSLRDRSLLSCRCVGAVQQVELHEVALSHRRARPVHAAGNLVLRTEQRSVPNAVVLSRCCWALVPPPIPPVPCIIVTHMPPTVLVSD